MKKNKIAIMILISALTSISLVACGGPKKITEENTINSAATRTTETVSETTTIQTIKNIIEPDSIKYKDITFNDVTFKVPQKWYKDQFSENPSYVEGLTFNYLFCNFIPENWNDYTSLSQYFKIFEGGASSGEDIDLISSSQTHLHNNENVIVEKVQLNKDRDNIESIWYLIPLKTGAFYIGFSSDTSPSVKNDYSKVYDYIFENIEVNEEALFDNSFFENATTTTQETTTTEETTTVETTTTKETTTRDPVEREKEEIDNGISSHVSKEYKPTKVTNISVNDDLGTDKEGDFVVLVDLKWDVMNSAELSKKMLKMYSSDLAAFVAKEYENVQEIAIFWEVPYLKANAKVSYEREGVNMYLSDEYFGF